MIILSRELSIDLNALGWFSAGQGAAVASTQTLVIDCRRDRAIVVARSRTWDHKILSTSTVTMAVLMVFAKDTARSVRNVSQQLHRSTRKAR
jgi:hypothetical protein